MRQTNGLGIQTFFFISSQETNDEIPTNLWDKGILSVRSYFSQEQSAMYVYHSTRPSRNDGKSFEFTLPGHEYNRLLIHDH